MAPCIPSTWGSSPSRPCARSRVSARSRNSAARTWAPTAWAAMPKARSASGSTTVSIWMASSRSMTSAPRRTGSATARAAMCRGSERVHVRLRGDLGDPCSRHRSRIGPPAPEGGTEQQVEGQVGVTCAGRPFGHGAQLHDPARVARDAVVEDLAQPLDPRPVELGELGAFGRGDQAVDQVGAAEPEADLGGEQQPTTAPGRVGGQLGGTLQGGDGRGDPASAQALHVAGLELVGDARRPDRRSPASGARCGGRAGRRAPARAPHARPVGVRWTRPAGCRSGPSGCRKVMCRSSKRSRPTWTAGSSTLGRGGRAGEHSWWRRGSRRGRPRGRGPPRAGPPASVPAARGDGRRRRARVAR